MLRSPNASPGSIALALKTMTITREDLNPCTIQLTITCEANQVKSSFDRAFKRITKNVKLPGFRPGAAPRAMLEPLINQEEWMEEAANILVRDSLPKAIEQEGLKPDTSTAPSVELKKFEKDAGEAEYVAKVPLPPDVKLGDYKGLPAAREEVTVTDEEIQFQIDEMRRRRGSRQSVTDRGAQEGDIVTLAIKPDGEAESTTFMAVVGKVFEELTQALVGMKTEEMKHLTLAFPDDFTVKSLAGQSLPVTVTVNTISAVMLPEMDDEFAQSLQTENVDDLKQRVETGLLRAKEMLAFEVATDKLINTVLEASTIEVSDNMWESLADRRIRETAQEQAQKGSSLEAYVKGLGQTVEEFIESWKERAKSEIRRALVIQTIFVQEKLQLTNVDLNEELQLMANEYGVEPLQLAESLQKNKSLDELQFRAIQRKVRQFLLDNAAHV